MHAKEFTAANVVFYTRGLRIKYTMNENRNATLKLKSCVIETNTIEINLQCNMGSRYVPWSGRSAFVEQTYFTIKTEKSLGKLRTQVAFGFE